MPTPSAARPCRSGDLLLWGAALATAVATFLLAAAPPGAAFVDSPEPGHTGGFGEPTCRSCHFDGPLNDPDGGLTLEGLPERAEAGSSYRLAVVLERPGLERGGFQLSARFAAGARRGESAGRLEPVDERAAVTPGPDGAVVYAHHTRDGTTAVRAGTLRWEIDWTAPLETSALIAVHVAANASNDDDSELGDFIYAAGAETVLAPPIP